MDHPRRCGENQYRNNYISMLNGSPPQVRGKQGKEYFVYGYPGITPAGAGKTYVPANSLFLGRDHPRRCGENNPYITAYISNSGSPPQVRGKQGTRTESVTGTRITPAGAGKTRISSSRSGASEDHPRRCGENILQMRSFIILPGSPPQVRGKPPAEVIYMDYAGITPAGAGKTVSSVPLPAKKRDHPRRCGENAHPTTRKRNQSGSPPQVRGKLKNFILLDVALRITPAGAGKTADFETTTNVDEDHPRRCGENSAVINLRNVVVGSPPQVRGKPDKFGSTTQYVRITPAGAGKTPNQQRIHRLI